MCRSARSWPAAAGSASSVLRRLNVSAASLVAGAGPAHSGSHRHWQCPHTGIRHTLHRRQASPSVSTADSTLTICRSPSLVPVSWRADAVQCARQQPVFKRSTIAQARRACAPAPARSARDRRPPARCRTGARCSPTTTPSCVMNNTICISMDIDRPSDGVRSDRVFVAVEAHQAGLRDRRR